MEIVEVTTYQIYDDGEYLGEHDDFEEAIKELEELLELNDIKLNEKCVIQHGNDCVNCLVCLK